MVYFKKFNILGCEPNFFADVGSRIVVKMVYEKHELSGVYSIGAGSDCALFGFTEDVALKEKWSEATKLNMVKEGFLCQKHSRVGDVVFGKRSRLLHDSVPLDVSSEDTSVKLAGVLSVEYAEKVGKREEARRTRAKEKVVKELAERDEVRILKMRDMAGENNV